MGASQKALFQKIPAVDRLLTLPAIQDLSAEYSRPLVLKAVHRVLDELRAAIQAGEIEDAEGRLGPEAVCGRVAEALAEIARPSLRPVINATGIVVHTNLGRSILAERVLERLRVIGGGYSNLEYDLTAGRRGSRYVHAEEILRELTGAEAAMVVNNNAAAVLISLQTLAHGREVVVSRGQLVEIGGSFRIPEVMRKSGAIMVEVGTTNKTHLRDYEEAVGPETALLLKVHTSNYQIVGFTQEVALSELSELGRRRGLPVMEDLGSGCFTDFSALGLVKEPTVQEALGAGADLITFSGDKLLGGPQAGIILGKRDLVAAIRKNQLNRALRIDKLTLAALEETLRLYRDEQTALETVPTLRAISQPYGDMCEKAERLAEKIGPMEGSGIFIALVDGASKTGGGALPLLELKSRLVALTGREMSAQKVEAALRDHDPPIIARVEKEQVLLDVRTIGETELDVVAGAVRGLVDAGPGGRSGAGKPDHGG